MSVKMFNIYDNIPIPLNNSWNVATLTTEEAEMDHQCPKTGHEFRVIANREHTFSCGERLGRGLLGLVIVIATLVVGWLIFPCSREYVKRCFIKTEIMKLVVYKYQIQCFFTGTVLKNFSYLSAPEIVEALPRLPRSELPKLAFISDNQLAEIDFTKLTEKNIEYIFKIDHLSIIETRRRIQFLSPKKLATPKFSPFLRSLAGRTWKNVSYTELADLFYEPTPQEIRLNNIDRKKIGEQTIVYGQLTPEQKELIKPHFSEKILKALNLPSNKKVP